MEDEQVIRDKMEDTRTALTEKLETLEHRVVDTVTDATNAVSQTVETVKETVQDTVASVKGSVSGAMDAVKDTFHEGMHTVKDMFDLQQQVQQHPWCAVGAAVCAGYFLETLLAPRGAASAPHAESKKSSMAAMAGGRMNHGSNGGSSKHRRSESWAGSMMQELAPEITKLKGLALGALLGVTRDMIVQAVPIQLGDQLKEVIDNTTRKLGGEPMPSDAFGSNDSHLAEMGTRMGRPTGPT